MFKYIDPKTTDIEKLIHIVELVIELHRLEEMSDPDAQNTLVDKIGAALMEEDKALPTDDEDDETIEETDEQADESEDEDLDEAA